MVTLLQYLVIAAVIGAVVFVIAALVFGRGEQMAPLPSRVSPSELPDDTVRGDDVRAVRFGLALRGYRMSDVDWTLDRLSEELDRLHARIDQLTGADIDRPAPGEGPNDLFAEPSADAPRNDEPPGDTGHADPAPSTLPPPPQV